MNPILDTEDAIIAAVNVPALKGVLRPMETLPGRMSLEVLKKIAAATPATYVAFLGGRQGANISDIAQLNASFAIYFITDHITGNVDRRRGDARKMGAYDLINIILPLVNGLNVTDVGPLTFKGVENLFSVDLDKQGVTIYAATFDIPMSFAFVADEANLNAFITYSADHSMAPGNDEPAAQDLVQLEQ